MNPPCSWGVSLRWALLASVTAVLPLTLPAEKIRLDRSSPITRSTAFPGHEYDQFRVVDVDPATAAALVAAGAGEIIEDADRILLHAEILDTTKPEVKAQRRTLGAFTGKRLHLVHFSGPIREKWVVALEADGLQVVGYVPTNAFLVYGDAASLSRFQARALDPASAVQWEGAWQDRWKLVPNVFQERGKAPETARQLSVEMLEDPVANEATFAALRAAGGTLLRPPRNVFGQIFFTVQLDPSALPLLAARPEVLAVRRYFPMKLHDEMQDRVLGGSLSGNVASPGNYLTQLANWGFTQAQFDLSNFIVDVSDQGVDNGTTTPNHFALYRSGNKTLASRLAYRITYGTAGSDAGTGKGGHAGITTSIVGGFVPNTSVTVGGNTTTTTAFPHADSNQLRYGMGVAPFVKVGNSTIFDPSDTFPDYTALQTAAWNAGARISNNSWGASNGDGSYNSTSQEFDVMTYTNDATRPMVVVFSAGNDGSGANTVASPATAKNVITVGAAEGTRGINSASDSTNDIADFSSRGPCDDGRMKPDLVAGGSDITGATYVTSTSTLNGTAASGYRYGFYPANQQWWTSNDGTSFSAPAIAGAAALVYQQFINNPAYLATYRTPAGSAPPSPALVKAYLINSTRYMGGNLAGGNLPAAGQGFGHANLGMAFDGVSRIIRDQVTTDRVATGQSRVFTGNVADGSKPLRVTLVWTDPPAASSATYHFVNNLNLTVEAGGALYRGNVFSGADSVPGGISDARNNVECVYLPAGAAPNFVVTVTGVAVPVGSPQKFALVIYNGISTTTPVIKEGTPVVGSPGTLQRNSCQTLNIPLTNSGTANATSVVANLSTTTPGVNVIQADSTYPNLTAGGAAQTNATAFRISTDASIPCGTVASFTLILTHSGGTGFTVREFSLPVGTDPTNYDFTPSSGTVFPNGTETTLSPSSYSTGLVSLTVPFAISAYGTTISTGGTVRASIKGNLQLRASGGSTSGANVALPASTFDTGATLMPLWDEIALSSLYMATLSSGTAPNRKWGVLWAGELATTPNIGGSVVFGVVFTEGVQGFQYTYSTVSDYNGPNGSTATVGVQAGPTGLFAQYGLNQHVLSNNFTLTARYGTCVAGSGPCATPDITSPADDFAVVGTPFSRNFTATGNPAPAFALTGGTLPPGLSLSAAGVLSGTLSSAGTGTYSGIMVTASNGLSPSSTQSFTLHATTAAGNYLAGFGLTGPDALLTADPNGDGTSNLLAYALGLSPIANAGIYDIGTVRDYGGTKYLSIRFNRSSVATDLTYIVEACEDLTFNWQELAYSSGGNPMQGTGGVVVSETGGPPTYVTEVRDTVPAPPAPGVPQRFIRLRVLAMP